ncbi:S-layer homology domain-containing protein [Paenibacillus sp. sptzw28]|uniref:S-layer homology domain-containing protein n=1 Tax=Paenibacillus sp. sptzw28 TaxID=715179 RepID=UPI001C6EA4B5|nr:S-layer homology domain-containing protein [Paenibacillus sp. sptzw28]QYR21150.1 S-layer homology domain-containing protein [Paenibacillus sp. sptzw28]
MKKKSVSFSACIIALSILVLLSAPFPAFAQAQAEVGIQLGGDQTNVSLGAEASLADVGVQLVADQATVSLGGEASLHLLVWNNTTEPKSDVTIDLKLPEGLEVLSAGEAKWNAELRLLQWKLVRLSAGGAAALDFNVQIGADGNTGTGGTIKLDTNLPLGIDGKVVLDTGLSIGVPDIQLTIGSQTDQPFFKGFPDGKFHPASNMTRAEAASVIVRVKNLKLKPDEPVRYADVSKSHWAYENIVKVTQEGYMAGSNGKFRPNEPISRAEMVAIILRLRGVKPVSLPSFIDVKGHWAEDAIGTAKSLHIIDGQADKFYPDRYLRRDEAAKLINLGLSRGPLVDGDIKVIQHFKDINRSNWAFGWVEEASVVAHVGEYRTPDQESLIRYVPEQTIPFN